MANEKFFSVRHPSAHATDKRFGMLVLTVSAAGSWAIPPDWQGQLLGLCPIGADLLYSITDTAKTINPAAVSDPNGTMLDTVGFPIVAGGFMDRAANGKFLNYVPRAGGTLTLYGFITQELVRLGG